MMQPGEPDIGVTVLLVVNLSGDVARSVGNVIERVPVLVRRLGPLDARSLTMKKLYSRYVLQTRLRVQIFVIRGRSSHIDYFKTFLGRRIVDSTGRKRSILIYTVSFCYTICHEFF